MKSQDIVLLLKLVSLQQREQELEQGTAPYLPFDWQDWEPSALDDGTLDEARGEVGAEYSVRALAQETGISKSQVSLALQRCYEVGLAKPDRKSGLPRANAQGLLEFLVHGLRYVFPAKPAAVTRGIATGLAAPVLEGKLMTAGELPHVWPDARGGTKGQAVEPLIKGVPGAVRRDPRLYAYLALVDALRLGQPRERALAADRLAKLLKEQA